MKELVTVNKLLELGIPRGTAYRMAKEGTLPSYRIGPKKRGVRFVVEEVLAALRTIDAGKKRNDGLRSDDGGETEIED